MSEPSINCPECGTEIKLTESLAGPIIAATRKEFEDKIRLKDEAISKQKAALQSEFEKLDKARENLDEEVQKEVDSVTVKIANQEREKATKIAALEIENKSREAEELKAILTDREEKLAVSQIKEAEFIKKQREMEEDKRAMEVTIQNRVNEETKLARARMEKEAQGAMNLKVKEKEATISAMQKQIEDLKRRAEQGSQQLQGEVLEIELETALASKYIFDEIEPIAKGVQGGDVLQKVMSPNGTFCGKILWETKRTKNWSGSWVQKLKEDQRRSQADIAIIMTSALPQEIVRFGQINDVWVTDFESAFSLVDALRLLLIQVANTKTLQDGQGTKMELVYEYLTGPKFRHRVEAIVEKFADMKGDLDKEKRVMMKNWAKREVQIENVINSTLGMYGDLEGIAGQAMPELEQLEMPKIE